MSLTQAGFEVFYGNIKLLKCLKLIRWKNEERWWSGTPRVSHQFPFSVSIVKFIIQNILQVESSSTSSFNLFVKMAQYSQRNPQDDRKCELPHLSKIGF